MSQNNVLIYGARHGQTSLNAENKFRGPVNVPLDATGQQDAVKLARFFAFKPIAAIFSSDKDRALETAHTIAQRKPGLQVNPTSALQAWNIGIFSGQSKDKYESVLKSEYSDHPDRQVPGGESLNEFRARVHPVFHQALQMAMHTKKPVLLVSHASVIHEMGAMFNGDHESAVVKPGGVTGVTTDGQSLQAVTLYRPEGKGAHGFAS